jgi:hypothetical protein
MLQAYLFPGPRHLFLDGEITTFSLVRRHKPVTPMARSYLYVLPSPNVVRGMASKKVTVRALWEVDLKQPTTKSNPDLKIETAQNNQKKACLTQARKTFEI